MSGKSGVNVSRIIDDSGIRALQIGVIIMCGLVAAFDGYDTQVISFVAPVIGKLWHVPAASFASVFSMGLVGLAIGALVSGPIADRIGRKTVVVTSVFLFGFFSLLTVSASNLSGLIWLRFFTGLGLGGSMPNVIALMAEYAPHRLRKTLVSVMFIGFPVGSVVASLLAANLIPTAGWHSLFYIGGIIPFVLGIVLIFAQPESIRFLVTKGKNQAKVAKLLNRISGTSAYDADDSFHLPEKQLKGFSLKHLFTEGRAKDTILLWIVFFMNLLIIYFVVNWLPTVLKGVGFPLSKAIIAVAALQGGGIIGGILQGYWSDRGNPKIVLGTTFFLGSIALVATGFTHSIAMALTILFIAGFLVVGAQFGINALAASVYPTSVRSTGVSWAFGIGRVGSIIGPMIGGSLIAAHVSLSNIFIVAAIPSLLAAIAILFTKTHGRSDEGFVVDNAVVDGV